MRCLNRTRFLALLFIVMSNQLLAGDGSLKPQTQFSPSFMGSVKKLDAIAAASNKTGKTGVKICSCQILEMKSNNFEHKNVAVFAEKTNFGKFSADYGVATDVIEKEKKHIRLFFYDKVKVVNKVAEATDCKSLYIKLKDADQSLVMYDILDADVRK
ncbi:MAG TPA: hypothetical protein VK543_19465 [Puia sp.]|nr:hypothetical protein [Puia sp.]